MELSGKDYLKFREWFWKHENEKWDEEIEKDIKEAKFEKLALTHQAHDHAEYNKLIE